MTSKLQFTPLYGVKSEDPLCYRVELDNFSILLDCGWTDSFDQNLLAPLAAVAPEIDAVLISHPDLLHMGALPYAVKHLGLKAPIYATLPIIKMGQMFFYDIHESKHAKEEFDVFSLDDVDDVFSSIVQLKHSQRFRLRGKGDGIEISPHVAGHMIGGSIWRIVKDTADILYAVDYNHKTERHLNGAVLETFSRPTLLITDTLNANCKNQIKREDRDRELYKLVSTTLSKNGNILIPVDTAGRVLELAMVLDGYWQQTKPQATLVLLHNVSTTAVEFAKSQLEYMSETVVKAHTTHRENPFNFKALQVCLSKEQLSKVEGPKCVLATSASLNTGFARDLFVEWCGSANNLVVLPDRSHPGTLARELMDSRHSLPRNMQFKWSKRVVLEGAELEAWRQKKARESARRLDGAQAEGTRQSQRQGESDSEEEDPVVAPPSVVMEYPLPLSRPEWDDYGEVCRPENMLSLAKKVAPKSVEEDSARQESAVDSEAGPRAAVEEEEEEEEVPTKCVVTNIKVEVNCRVVFIDFEGRSDGRSIFNIIREVAPRKIVLVHGPADPTEEMRKWCLSNVSKLTFAPDPSEKIDLSSDTTAFPIKLSESLYASLDFQEVGRYSIAYVTGYIHNLPGQTHALLDSHPPEEPTIRRKRKFHESLGPSTSPGSGDELTRCDAQTDGGVTEPASQDGPAEKKIKRESLLEEGEIEDDAGSEVSEGDEFLCHDAVYVGDLRMADLKKVLVANDLKAEFCGGVLVCNDRVTIRKTASRKVLLEGLVCPEYFRVRDLVLKQFVEL